MRPLLQVESIGKSFFGVPVLQDVSFQIDHGRIVGLVGENGAGKSTLMNLLGGNLWPEQGTFRLGGKPYAPKGPSEARAAGIGFVHQELNLFPNLTIGENLCLTHFPRRGPFIRRGEVYQRAAMALQRVGLDRSPSTPIESLSIGERQLVEIAHALALDARLILFDEPTTSLSTREAQRLFKLIRQLCDEGRSILYISHALTDVLELCEEVVVLRDGRVVGQGPASEWTQTQLISRMVGRELHQIYPERRSPRSAAPGSTLLEVTGISQPGVVQDISFGVDRGEILGLAGLMGAGRSELARILFGLDPHAEGQIRLSGQRLDGSVRRRVQRRMAMLTENRRDDGLCLEASLADNMALVSLPRQSRTPFRWLQVAELARALGRIREAVRLQPKLDLQQTIKTLSGGNQQKAVLAKWLLAEPSLLILDEPTRGIDLGAKSDIYQLIRELADRGAGVLLISSELEELTGLCDRILVMNRGRLSGEFEGPEFDRERILSAALPV